ncbi:MAG: penicillin-binding protein activator [Lautropia sp.]
MFGSLATASSICGAGGWLQPVRAQSLASAVDRIGLLLPKSSGAFGRASAALRAGIEAGYRRDGRGLAIDIYEIDETPQSLVAAYRGMLERSTALVLGPLTRSGATALLEVGDVPITTIALNQIDGDGAVPWNVIIFTLAVEQEAMQIADTAFQAARQRLLDARPPRASIVTATTMVGKRAAGMFYERWRSLGGSAELPIELEESALYKFRTAIKREEGDLYFLSMAPQLARPVRIIVGRSLPVYGTSLLSTGSAVTQTRAPELDGVRFVEMPAVIDPNYAASLGYPWVPPDFTLEMQRLYALGIDAFRVARAMFSGRSSFDIDGLTGKLRYDGAQPRVERLASLAEYRDGAPVVL